MLLVALAAALLTGCAGGSGASTPAAVETALPAGLTAYVDQGRQQRQDRLLRVRLVNEAEREVTVTRAEISSDRIDPVVWTGEKTFHNEADLVVEPALGRCGTGAAATVRLTYRVDGGPLLVSTTTAADRYHQVELQLDRDCAERTMAEAAQVRVGAPAVVGVGAESVLELPVTLVPTGRRDDVAFTGFAGTVLFTQAPGSADVALGVTRALDAAPVEVPLRLVPARCDPHALAEDKVGTLVGVGVAAPEVPAGSLFYLPLPDDTRAALRAFFVSHCGL